jgi:hypothetical protein
MSAIEHYDESMSLLGAADRAIEMVGEATEAVSQTALVLLQATIAKAQVHADLAIACEQRTANNARVMLGR